MTKYNLSVNGGFTEPSEKLQELGALIKIGISPPASLSKYLAEIPSTIIGWGIIDTGASTTCVNKSTLEKIGGKPVGSRKVSTPGDGNDETYLDLYPAKITFPGTKITVNFEEALAMKDLNIKHEELPILAFLGRDVLTGCIFTYDGKTGNYYIEI